MIDDFVVRPEAEADSEEAYAWYESRSAGLGGRFLDAVEEILTMVRDAPARFPVLHREPDLTIRRALLTIFPYGVFFIWDEADTQRASSLACMADAILDAGSRARDG